MKVFDKAQWHIDGGENSTEIIEKFKAVFQFLSNNGLLSEEGLEIFHCGIDSSVSLHERLVSKEGYAFLSDNYDNVVIFPAAEVSSKLTERYTQFKKEI